MAMYESEHTKFIREWMQKHPEQRQEIQEGRALWCLLQPQTMARAGDLGRFCRNHSLLSAAGSSPRATAMAGDALEKMTVSAVQTVPIVHVVQCGERNERE